MAWFAGQLYPRWDQQKVTALIEHFGLDPKQKVKHLSRGMNAQLNLALVLGHDPELLILDEPASGLNVIVRCDVLESVIQVIGTEGRTVFFSSHLVKEKVSLPPVLGSHRWRFAPRSGAGLCLGCRGFRSRRRGNAGGGR